MSKVRRATHAGTWYSDVREELSGQLEGWLGKAKPTQKSARAIIAPHAGYYYCGACGAHAYRQVDPSTVNRVFILGPSHHVRMSGCALSGTETYKTPLYDLTIDKEIYGKLYATGAFDTMSITTDEGEHSIEMHLPYVAKIMESRKNQFTIVPILVGSLSADKEKQYGAILSSYLANPENLIVVSSDFCHWGKRFNYTFYDKSYGKIWQSIEALDRAGMGFIERLDPAGFSAYLRDYQNTICGRHPIGVLLNTVWSQFVTHTTRICTNVINEQLFRWTHEAVNSLRQNGNGLKMDMNFLKYAQSSQCTSHSDSSVSYAAGALFLQ